MQIIELSQKTSKYDHKKCEQLAKDLRKEYEKPVQGKFEFVDAGGGYIEFNYRFFKSDPIIKVTLTHGEICTMPMGIVKHLNNTYKKVRKLDPTGLNIKTNRGVPPSYETISRVRFTPMEWIGQNDSTNLILN